VILFPLSHVVGCNVTSFSGARALMVTGPEKRAMARQRHQERAILVQHKQPLTGKQRMPFVNKW